MLAKMTANEIGIHSRTNHRQLDILWHRSYSNPVMQNSFNHSAIQFCVDSGTLTYKNVNFRHCHSCHFLLTFLQALYCEAESYVSHHQTSKHQCTHLVSVPNLNSQASSPFSKGWKPPYLIQKQKTELHKLKSASGCVSKNVCEWESNLRLI